MYLISYRSEYRGNVTYGYDTAENPIEWVASTQDDFHETYILLNAHPMTDQQYKKYDGEFRGM